MASNDATKNKNVSEVRGRGRREWRNQIAGDNIKFNDKKKEIIFNLETTSFPSLGTNSDVSNATVVQNYKIAVTTLPKIAVSKDEIRPGWVEITKKSGKNHGMNIYTYGQETEYQKQQRERTEIENTPHFIMNKAVSLMKISDDRYIRNYNSINGEGAYEEKFVMSPVYGSDYSSDEFENDDGDDDNDSYEYL